MPTRDYSNCEPNDESLEALAEAEAMRASGEPPRFKNLEEMFAELGIEKSKC
ncbi:MAG: hypothetical protein Q4C71_04095 [Microbacteriaceae bacterium]|nr:hypothetical protein [Microbacteriaceae bacterium]